MNFLYLTVVGCFFLQSYVAESLKTVTVHGQLQCKCDKNTFGSCAKATVILLEDDGGKYDDEMTRIDVTIGRSFTVKGSEHEYFHIEPYLLINHGCPDGKPKQKRIDLGDVSGEKEFKMSVNLNGD